MDWNTFIAAFAASLGSIGMYAWLTRRGKNHGVEEWTERPYEPPVPTYAPRYAAPARRPRITKQDIDWENT